jgi:peptidyl-prolyl cis-trans isomerase SurA
MKNGLMLSVTTIIGLLFIPWLNIYSQMSDTKQLDKIVAIVGKEVVFASDVEGRAAVFAQQKKVDPNNPQFKKQILNDLVNEKLIITKAIEDSVEVAPEEVNQRLDYTIQNLIQQYGSERRVEDLYGMSIDRLKRNFRDDMRKQMMAERLQQQKFFAVKCTPREVEEFYQRYKDSLPVAPAQLELSHIVIYVKPSAEIREEIRQKANKIRDSIIKGGDFADFAKRYSADAMSAVVGGEVGWAEKGKFVAEYEKAAFALQPGEISAPIESPFGYHVIQLNDKRLNATNTRHILFKLGGSNDDNQRVKDTLLALKQKIIAGAPFDDMARRYSEEKETQGFGGAMGSMDASRLGADLKSVLDGLPDGGVTDPLPYASDPTKPAFHIVWKKRTIAEHKFTLETDDKYLEKMAVNFKQTRMFEEWIKELRANLYWEIK